MIRLSKTSLYHYYKMIFRSILFVFALVIYIINKINDSPSLFGRFENDYIYLIIIVAIYAVEMILRLFPSKIESMGCQKIFKKNYVETDEKLPAKRNKWSLLIVIISWILLNSIFGVLYLVGIFDYGIMILICLAYAICDMICILYFCPFQTWIMKNKCCCSCRIYNWDYLMMFTPLIFVHKFYSYILLGLSSALVIAWEIIYKVHPERFDESTNASLKCANCKEKLCSHKKQLQRFLKKFNVIKLLENKKTQEKSEN